MQYYAYRSTVRGNATFSLLPLVDDAVYIDGMYYPEEATLVLFTKVARERFQMVPKLNQFGEAEVDRNARGMDGNHGREKMERIRMETNYEHYLSNPEDVEFFAKNYIKNHEEFLSFTKESFQKKVEKQLKTEEA